MPSLAAATELRLNPVSFGDVDQFSDWETGLGWDIESTQLSRGPNRIRFDHFLFPELLVGHFRARQSMQNVFTVPEGMVVFLVTGTEQPPLWCGNEIPRSVMAVLRSGRTHWVVLPPDWDCYEFMVSEDLIRRTELFPPEFFEGTSRLEKAVLPLVEPQTSRFYRGLGAFFPRAEKARGTVEFAVARSEFYEFILAGLQSVIDAGLEAAGSPSLRRSRRADLFPQARELMVASVGTALTADEVAQTLGVSYRVLNYCFREAVGVSPYRYFLTEKLHAARRRLKAGETSVTEVCFETGFSTPSRFSRQYRQLFGELPSETSPALIGKARRSILHAS